jgi:hypothetical protein
MNKAIWSAGLLAFGLMACGGSAQNGKDTASSAEGPVVSKDERTRCNAAGKKVTRLDLNRDNQADVWKLYEVRVEGGAKVQALTCKEIDLNFDGRKDIWIHYDEGGNRKMEEMDLDFDGKVDLITIRQGGKVMRQDLDTNYDGKPDIWKYFEEGVISRLDRDSNGDGKVDYWEYYEGGKLDRIGYDKNGDGRVDAWDRAAKTETPTPSASSK